MAAAPLVSVVMSVYNGKRYLEEAIKSILNQTFGDFEFIIIDDGSTDNTWAILQSHYDGRMKLVRQEHRGLIASLNRGLVVACGEYMARMDADDIALPDRLEKQVAFLRTYPEIGILGTACRLIDATGRDLGLWRWPVHDLEIRWKSLLSSPFGHPMVIMRRDILIKNGLEYDETLQRVEDYDLWIRVLNYTSGANLREPLMLYRVHDDRVTSKFRKQQLGNHDAVALRSVQKQLPEFAVAPEQVSQLRQLFIEGSDAEPALDGRRVALAETYLDMWTTFASRHVGEPGLEALQRQEALKVASLVVRLPLRHGWLRVVRRLLITDPRLALVFSGYLWTAVGHKLKRSGLKFYSAFSG